MRVALISDVHANLPALEAVLRHAEARRALDQVWSLGDLVGYGPHPGECLALLRRYPFLSVVGNHDLAATGDLDTGEFNPDAAAAVAWTARRLTEGERAFLRGLPLVRLEGEFTLVHGSLRHPVWEYILGAEAARAHLARQQTPYGLVGHTHVPMLCVEPAPRQTPVVRWPEDGEAVMLTEQRLIINPGGVGQPRDGDPRAAYAILDLAARTVTFHRVDYDIARTQQAMREAGLPWWLILRLSYGR
jgi:diadenosine tetraphosphatase ApaH/serine/threonine PP2A family protein phosphatase